MPDEKMYVFIETVAEQLISLFKYTLTEESNCDSEQID